MQTDIKRQRVQDSPGPVANNFLIIKSLNYNIKFQQINIKYYKLISFYKILV